MELRRLELFVKLQTEIAMYDDSLNASGDRRTPYRNSVRRPSDAREIWLDCELCAA